MKKSGPIRINSAKFLSQPHAYATAPVDTFFCAHMGQSMNPTLTAQDLLEIKPYKKQKPKAGDVILFQPSGLGRYVVHRIVNISINGIQTKGDNNCNTDTDILQQEDLCGRVIAAHRGNLRRNIASGSLGKVVAKYCQLKRITVIHAVRFLRPVYLSLCSNGHLHRLIPIRIQPQVASFKAGTNVAHKLLLGNRIIGSYDKFRLQWQIRRPYRIFIDESSLPTP